MRKISWFALLLVAVGAYAQSFERDSLFAIHLENEGLYEEGSSFLATLRQQTGASPSLSYLQGKFEYLQKDRSASVAFFQEITDPSLPFWNASRYYSSWQLAQLGERAEARNLLETTIVDSPTLQQLTHLQLAGIALLDRDLPTFDSLSGTFDNSLFQLRDHQVALIDLGEQLNSQKRKSPVVAGVLSAIVPGAGRYYQGQIGQGTMSLMASAIFALQAYEGYRKDGPKSPAFIVFGSAFSIFYVANIWGSVVAVRVNEVRFNQSVNEAVLLHMHIPVRLLFQ